MAAASADGAQVVLGEAAHIVGDSDRGPRGASALSAADRDRYANLILLCSRHHQLVDADPAKYTVDILHRFKDEHEKSVEQRMGPVDEEASVLPVSRDVVYSTLLTIERMPAFVYTAPCELTPNEILERQRLLRAGEVAPFIQRAGQLIAFQDLRSLDNPFASVANPLEAISAESRQWWIDPEKSVWYSDLLNRTLNKFTGRRGLHWDKMHRRYYFPASDPVADTSVTYRPLNRESESRMVVWQPKKKSTGEARPHWFHRAISLRFIRIDGARWVLSLRPELRVTRDGYESIESRRIGARVTRKKSRLHNYDLLGEIQFWRDYLGEGRPRITLSFGAPSQQIVLSMNLLSSEVSWPGIPPEYSKAFRNVEYVDDLFTWAEAQPTADDDEDAEAEELDEAF